MAPPPPPPPPPGGRATGAPPPPPPPPGAGAAPKRKLKALHWDKLRAAGPAALAGTAWAAAASRSAKAPVQLDMDALESLFRVVEAQAVVGGGGSTPAKPARVELVEHRRAHNICIELAGIRLPFPAIKAALGSWDAGALSLEQLAALGRAVPEDAERRAVAAYLKGEHPRYKGLSDPALLGTVERYFVEVMDIPRLAPRISAVAFARAFDATADRASRELATLQNAAAALTGTPTFVDLLAAVLDLGNALNAGTHRGGAAGFRLDTLLKLADVKGADRKTSLLHFVLGQVLAAEGKREKEGGGGDGDAADAPPAPAPRSVRTLSSDLAVVKAGAGVQVSAVKAMLADARTGLARVDAELAAAVTAAADSDAAGDVGPAAAAHRAFAGATGSFAESARARVDALDAEAGAAHAALAVAAAFFGEDFDEADPTRVLRVVRDFLGLFDRAAGEIAKAAAADATAAAAADKRVELERRVRDAGTPKAAAATPRPPPLPPSPPPPPPAAAAAAPAASAGGGRAVDYDVVEAKPSDGVEAAPAAAEPAAGAAATADSGPAAAPPPPPPPAPVAKPAPATSTPVAVRASAGGRVFAPPPPPPPPPPRG